MRNKWGTTHTHVETKKSVITHREAAVVEENVSLLELAKLALLLVLLDGIANFIGSNFVLFPVGIVVGRISSNRMST